MKYKLETIPVWDAFDADGECPFCLLEEKAEAGYLKFFLGNSVMVPEMRVEVNETGFCRIHFPMLFNTRSQRHALGLMTHTHFGETRGRIGRLLAKITGQPSGKNLAKAAGKLRAETDSCMICSRVDETVRRYVFTALYLWKKDEEGFRERYRRSKGFCRHHLAFLLEMAGDLLAGRQLREWAEATEKLQRTNMERLDGELFWYTQKFDFQNDDKPWGTSKDALERALQKLTGKILSDP